MSEYPKIITSPQIIYLTGLNGLRAIASLSVLIAHIIKAEYFGIAKNFRLPLAEFGVTLFFVISGFLITYLLLMESSKSKIDISKFYIRRALRIWPLYYVYIIVCIIIGQSTSLLNFNKELYWYVFFVANVPFILNQGIIVLVHYWSIGVEEQFYLIWPWIVKLSKGKILQYSFIIFILFFLAKIFFWYFLGKESVMYRFFSITRFHCMMVGAIGAILYYKESVYVHKYSINTIFQLFAWVFFFFIGFGIIHTPAPFAHELFSIISLVLIIGQVINENKLINLEKRLFVVLGKLSYSIYIIHPLIILLISKLLKDMKFNQQGMFLIWFLSILIATFLLSYISYTYLEKPFLKLKYKFAEVYSTNDKYESQKLPFIT